MIKYNRYKKTPQTFISQLTSTGLDPQFSKLLQVV